MEVNSKEIKDLCDLIECGIFMFMKKYQEKKSLTIKEFNSFLSDVTKLSKESDFPLIGYKVLRIKRNWTLLEKCYEKNSSITTSEKSFIKLISDRFNNINVECDNINSNFSTDLSDDDILNNNDRINECVELFMEKINDEESQKTINASLDKLKELENYLELFEFCNIDSVSEELENCQTLWNVFSELYDNLEKDPFVFEQIQIIKEMFETILTVVDESVFQNVVIDESELLEIEDEVNQFDYDVSNKFFEERKSLNALKFVMKDGEIAYKLLTDFELGGGITVSYISDGKYYNQNRKLVEYRNIHPTNLLLNLHNCEMVWDEVDMSAVSKKNRRKSKICASNINPEPMKSDLNYAFELRKEETIQRETGEPIYIKYISLDKKFYDKKQGAIYVTQSRLRGVSLIEDKSIFVEYDDQKYNFDLLKKSSTFSNNRKDIDAIEYNEQKTEMEQKYKIIESKICENISKIEYKSDFEEYCRLKDLLSNLKVSREKYIR